MALSNKQSGDPVQFACSDETTPLSVASSLTTLRSPRTIKLTEVRASVTIAPTGVSLLTVDVLKNGVSVLSTLITFNSGEFTSTTALTPPVIIPGTTIDDDDEITVDVTQIGSTIPGSGLKVSLIGPKK